MSIFHLQIKIISRGKGKSAVAAAAYRAGETITNGCDEIIHDYTRKGGIVHTEILLPENAPSQYDVLYILFVIIKVLGDFLVPYFTIVMQGSVEIIKRVFIRENFTCA